MKREYAGPVLVLQYEQFWDDYDYIFSNFEKFFDITLSGEIKTEIKNTTNRSVNKSIQETLQGVRDHHIDYPFARGAHFSGNAGVVPTSSGGKKS